MQKLTGFSQAELFKFPVSREGIEWFNSIEDIKQAFVTQFANLYGSNKDIQVFTVKVRCMRYFSNNHYQAGKKAKKLHKNLAELWTIACQTCTNTIYYGKIQGQSGYSLLKISYYHLHTEDRVKYLHFIKNTYNYTHHVKGLFEGVHKRVPSVNSNAEHMLNEVEYQYNEAEMTKFYEDLAGNLKAESKFYVMNKKFGLNREQFNKVVAKAGKSYSTEFEDLIDKFKTTNTSYGFVPRDTLEPEHPTVIARSQGTDIPPECIKDTRNPTLPNILVVSTPQMKEQYKLYGEYVGFDLTFSVISQRTSTEREYMVGIFAGTNIYKKIVVYAFVITNSQSVYAYSFIFQEFFRQMGSVPPIVITDEEKGMHYALFKLQKDGIFTGKHYFDTFHVLRKLRKFSSESSTFQLMRKLIHSKDKNQYRRLFKIAKSQLLSDDEVAMLRAFDLNSQRYSYSQLQARYIGLGASNSHNEFFHHLIKNEIPVCTHYTKAVQIILELIDKRIKFSQVPVWDKPLADHLGISFLNDLKKVISDKAFYYVLKEASTTPHVSLLSVQQEAQLRILPVDRLARQSLRGRNHYYVRQGAKFYLVQKKPLQSNQLKWSCLCNLQERSGNACSHILRVLLHLGETVRDNVSQRWFLDHDTIDKIGIENEMYRLRMTKKKQKQLYLGQKAKLRGYVKAQLKHHLEQLQNTINQQ